LDYWYEANHNNLRMLRQLSFLSAVWQCY